jgi:hypothetical protein
VVVAGGSRVEAFDPASAQFRTVPGSLGPVRSFSSVTALPAGSVLIVGGYDDHIRTFHDAAVLRPS